MADDIEDNNSEDDISPEAHNKLLDAVSKIYKKKRIEAPTRKEPTLEITEFHLTQPKTHKKTTKVKINDLIKVLNKKSKHDELTRKLKQTQKQSKTLFKPVEKPQAERINRSIGYNNVKARLNRWDPVVYQQRVATSLTFPLRQSEIKEPKSNDFLSTFLNPTELEIKMAEILKQSEEIQAKHKEEREKDKKIEDDEFPLTLAEMVERRKMMQKIRAQQSYRQIKDARHSKIKSKKFHRIQKREKIKNELKEFEELQKRDPEAALKKLEQLEKTRAEERASLRHKSTGQWAKNLTVRAKYDKEARIALAEQLKKSRELTQKLQINKDTSDEEEDSENDNNVDLVGEKSNDPNNPWVEKSEVQNFFSGYKKYWDEKNKTNELNKSKQAPAVFKDVKDLNQTNVKMKTIDSTNSHTVEELASNKNTDSKNEVQRKEVSLELDTSNDIMKKDNKTINNREVNNENKPNLNKVKRTAVILNNRSVHKQPFNNTEKTLKKQNETKIMCWGNSGTWIVSTVEHSVISKGDKNLDNSSNNLLKVKRKRNRKDKCSKQNTKISLKDLIDKIGNLEDKITVIHKKNVVSDKLSKDVFKMKEASSENIVNVGENQTNISSDIDEELVEVSGHSDNQIKNVDNIKALASVSHLSTTVTTKVSSVDDIDPKNFLTVTPKYLRSGVPDLITAGDQLDDDDGEVKEEERHMTISEAFADDDIVDEFRKEKEEVVKKDQIENIDLSLPGWGSWGGPNLPTAPRRKRKRFIVKFPKVLPRKDDKKSNVIINEDKDLPLKEHRVSDVPFPFKSVKDFEASIRAPIGPNWVPQSAHRKLILPPVMTKMGAIIEPMDESHLANQAT